MGLSHTAIFSFNQPIVISGSLGATFNSDSYEVKEVKTIAIQTIWSGGGTPIGNMELQASLDNVNFTRIQGSVLSVSGNSGTNAWNIQNVGYPYIRFRYVRTSGTADVQVTISGKII